MKATLIAFAIIAVLAGAVAFVLTGGTSCTQMACTSRLAIELSEPADGPLFIEIGNVTIDECDQPYPRATMSPLSRSGNTYLIEYIPLGLRYPESFEEHDVVIASRPTCSAEAEEIVRLTIADLERNGLNPNGRWCSGGCDTVRAII